MSEQPAPEEEVIVADIRITDNVLKRMVADEQRRLGDPNITKTAGRIIERYFAIQRSRTEPQHTQPSTA